jgi:hypothetical protein
MTSSSRFVLTIAAALLCAMAAPLASAGPRWTFQATVSDASRHAYGTMTDARGSSDNQQAIGCYHNATNGGCYATNSSGLSRTCSTSNPSLLNVIRAIGPESYIYFQWNTDGTCNYVLIENSSRFKPASASGY